MPEESTSKHSVLVVDDEPKILDAIDRELLFWKSRNNVEIHKADSGTEALAILEKHHDSIQVIISDLKMSGMSGDQLIHEAKRLYPSIRSILITGYSEVGGVSRAVSAGISAFIQKPWETRAFVAEVEKAMSQYRAEEMSREHQGRVAAQLQRTGQIQKSLFRHTVPSTARFSVDVAYHPLSEYHCGGDFYQVIPLGDQTCIIIIGDVSGHGLEAAFVTGIIRTLISREELAERAERIGFSPAAFLGRLNELILRELAPAPDLVITLTAAYLDCGKRQLTFSNAGNHPVYLVRPDSSDVHSVPGFPCGFSSEAQYTESIIPVSEGDKVVFMTDGLVERGRIAGFISLDAVRSVLTHFARDPGFHLQVVRMILEMFPEKKFYDDATLLTVSIR